jgi:hypothetical protein
MRKIYSVAIALLTVTALIGPAGADVQKEPDPQGDTGSEYVDLKWVSVKDTGKKIIIKLATYAKVPVKKLGITDSRVLLLSFELGIKEDEGSDYLGQIEYDADEGHLIVILSRTSGQGFLGWKILEATSKEGKVFTVKIPRKLVIKAKAGNKLLWRGYSIHETADPGNACFSSQLPDSPTDAPWGDGCYDRAPSSGFFQHKLS